MTDSPVAHPAEHAPEYDFWLWRLERRFISDRFRLWARSLAPEAQRRSQTAELRREILACALDLDVERLDKTRLQRILTALSPAHRVGITIITNEDLFIALHDGPLAELAMTAFDAENHWEYPHIVLPEWGQIPMAKAHTSDQPLVFQGQINDTRFRASAPAPEDDHYAMPYVIRWHDLNDRTDSYREISLYEGTPGLNIDLAPAAWDWLLARHLTVLCHQGKMSWPTTNMLFL